MTIFWVIFICHFSCVPELLWMYLMLKNSELSFFVIHINMENSIVKVKSLVFRAAGARLATRNCQYCGERVARNAALSGLTIAVLTARRRLILSSFTASLTSADSALQSAARRLIPFRASPHSSPRRSAIFSLTDWSQNALTLNPHITARWRRKHRGNLKQKEGLIWLVTN